MTKSVTILMLGAALACSDSEVPQADDPVAQGKTIYSNICIVCHNADPNLAGSLGPPIGGSSRKLLEAKVLRSEYPTGYTPKRPGKTMPRLAYLADGIDALAAYLASVAPASTTGSTGPDRAPQ